MANVTDPTHDPLTNFRGREFPALKRNLHRFQSPFHPLQVFFGDQTMFWKDAKSQESVTGLCPGNDRLARVQFQSQLGQKHLTVFPNVR